VVAADFWRNLHREFKDLAKKEECAVVPDPADSRRLRAYGEYEEEYGLRASDRQARFRAVLPGELEA
jgi:hypothetical protein